MRPQAAQATRIVMRLVVVVAVALSVIPTAFSFHQGTSCQPWRSRIIDFSRPEQQYLINHAGNLTAADPAAGHPATAATYVTRADTQRFYLDQRREDDGQIRTRVYDGIEWYQARLSGCGPTDAQRSLTAQRQSRHYSALAHATFNAAPQQHAGRRMPNSPRQNVVRKEDVTKIRSEQADGPKG